MTLGTIGWVDLTVDDAEGARDFYAKVVGWTPQPVDMTGYQDYSMCSKDGVPSAGVCHATGVNAGLPPVWLIYIVVADLDRSLKTCVELGGRLISKPRAMGDDRYCIIADPSGAACALYQRGP